MNVPRIPVLQKHPTSSQDEPSSPKDDGSQPKKPNSLPAGYAAAFLQERLPNNKMKVAWDDTEELAEVGSKVFLGRSIRSFYEPRESFYTITHTLIYEHNSSFYTTRRYDHILRRPQSQ